MQPRQIISIVSAAATFWLFCIIILFLTSSGTIPEHFLSWLVLDVFIVFGCYLWLASHQSTNVAGELRQRGWEVDVPTSSESLVPVTLLTIAPLEGQFVRCLYWGHRSGSTIDIVYGKIIESQSDPNNSQPFLFARAKLPFPVNGWVKVRPQFRGEIDHGIHLESVDFNQRFDVHADPKVLATKVLSPDIMNWYLDLEPKPRLFIQDGACYILFKNEITEPKYIDSALIMVEKFAELLGHSGALDKKA